MIFEDCDYKRFRPQARSVKANSIAAEHAKIAKKVRNPEVFCVLFAFGGI